MVVHGLFSTLFPICYCCLGRIFIGVGWLTWDRWQGWLTLAKTSLYACLSRRMLHMMEDSCTASVGIAGRSHCIFRCPGDWPIRPMKNEKTCFLLPIITWKDLAVWPLDVLATNWPSSSKTNPQNFLSILISKRVSLPLRSILTGASGPELTKLLTLAGPPGPSAPRQRSLAALHRAGAR
jgi:hypothetical protein